MRRKGLKKGLTKIVAVVMAVLMMTIGAVEPSYAANNSSNAVIPLSVSATKSVSLSISGGKAKAVCKVVGSSKAVDKIVINMYLQKKNNKGIWENYKAWYSTKSSYIHSLSKTATVASGTYRVMVRVICYDGSDATTSYLYTNTKIYSI